MPLFGGIFRLKHNRNYYDRFVSFSLRLHQRRSAKDGCIVVGQLGDANVHAALEDEAEVLLKRLAHGIEQHVACLHGTTKQEDRLRATESYGIGHGDA